MNAPYCIEKIWNYATRYTELACGPQRAYYTLDPNVEVASGPADAPSQPSQSDGSQNGSDSSGQNIEGNGNTQVSGSNNNIYIGDGGSDSGDDTKGGVAARLINLDAVVLFVLVLLMEIIL